MTRQEITNMVLDVLVMRYGTGREITGETHLEKDLGADSLDSVEIIMEIEDRFDVVISVGAAEKIKTVDDLIRTIEKIKA